MRFGTGRTGRRTDDHSPLTPQLQSNRLANTTTGTCYQGHLTLQSHTLLLELRPAPLA